MSQWPTILAIAGGGAAGAVARWWISVTINNKLSPGSLPLGTLAVNLIGCVAIGFCYIWFEKINLPPTVAKMIRIGLLGALTTFSTYCMESYLLIEKQSYLLAAGNLLGSVVLGMVGVMGGVMLAKSLGF